VHDDELVAVRTAEAPTIIGTGPVPVAADPARSGSRAARSSRRRWSRVLPAGMIAVTSLAAAAGCSATASTVGTASTSTSTPVSGDPEPGEPSARAALAGAATVIDVRTPDEYAAGHVDGARLIDVQDPGFDAEIADLDRSTTYVVYCRSGNRSAAAAERMRASGLTVLDGGSLDDMSAAGWAVAP
jgi:phage shock protein E